MRRVFRLSHLGGLEEYAWNDLCKAWMNGMKLPSGLPRTFVMAPLPKPTGELPPKPAERPSQLSRLSSTASWRQYQRLFANLQALRVMDKTSEDYKSWMKRMSTVTSDWSVNMDSDIALLRRANRPEDLNNMITQKNIIDRVSEALVEGRLDVAITAMQQIFNLPGVVK